MAAPCLSPPSLQRSTTCVRGGVCQVILLSFCALSSVSFQWTGAENTDVGQMLRDSTRCLQAQSVSGMERVCGFGLLLLSKFIEEFPRKEEHTTGQILP